MPTTPSYEGLCALVATCPPDRPFTLAEAREARLHPHLLAALVRHGLLRRPVRGVYIRADLADTIELRAAVLRLTLPSDAFVADRTAAWLHGATMALAPGDHLEVPTLAVHRLPTETRLRNPIVSGGRRGVLPRDLCEVQGVLATTPLRTALDLGRLQRRDIAIAGMDSLSRHAGITVEAMAEELGRFRGARGVVQLRALVPLVDPGSESAGESATRLRWHDADLPRPVCQVPVLRPDGRHWWLDLGLPEEKFGSEYDGEAFHGPDRRAHDLARRAWLRDTAGWQLEVFDRSRVYGPDQDATDALARAWRRHRHGC